MPDTISTVCTPFDGISKCGARAIRFLDGTNSITLPYKGFSLLTSEELMFDP
jgi:hypothetical protein